MTEPNSPLMADTGHAGARRPPTVNLSADNLQRLRSYPRPPQDNGIGLHFHLDLSDFFIAETVQNLLAIRAKWTLIYAPDELQTERAARACFAAGILPVIRIARKVDEPTDTAPFVQGLRRAWQTAGWGGDTEPLYVQLYNEPEDIREWVSGTLPADWPRRFGEQWARDALGVVGAGAFVGIQVLDRFGFDEAVDAVARNGQQRVWEKAFFVHHNYGQNHPPAYPYDAVKQQQQPGITILQDHVAALKFLAHAAWMQERLGFVLPIIGGEGGWWMFNDEDKNYPKVEWPLHAQYHREMYDWFRTGVLSNGEPTPDYLFSITSWIAGSFTFGAQNWWGNLLSPTGKLDQTISAMQSIPEFVRRFSWDSDGTIPEGPVPKPDTEPKREPEPKPVPDPTSAELRWDPRLDDLGVRLERAGSGARWRLVEARYIDDTESGGKHHILVKAIRRDGVPAAGVRFVADWLGRREDETPGFGTTDQQGDANMPMFIGFNPDLKNGIMLATVDGEPADTVSGMGLPGNHHVCFALTFREE